jgi:hypothetical protein
MMDKFTETEQSEILEIARVALADAGIFDAMAEALDISDDYMYKLSEKICSVTKGVDIEF